jgi:hypothetical protein
MIRFHRLLTNLLVMKEVRVYSIARDARANIGYIFLLLFRTITLFWLTMYESLAIS